MYPIMYIFWPGSLKTLIVTKWCKCLCSGERVERSRSENIARNNSAFDVDSDSDASVDLATNDLDVEDKDH